MKYKWLFLVLPMLLIGCTKKETKGAAIGWATGGVAGGVAGAVVGGNSDTEYINVKTNFVFTQPGTDKKDTMIYGADVKTADQASKYFVPVFDVNKDVWLVVEMEPTLTGWAKKLKRAISTNEEPIPVCITIQKTKNIQVSNVAGLEDALLETDIDGTARYTFNIKNKKKGLYSATFKFHPAELGSSQIHMTYGSEERQIVDKTCNVFTTVEFVK